jgi:hypothetical protein
VSWEYGTLVTPRTPQEPPGLDDGTAAAVLDAAEDIVNAAGPGILAEVQAERAAAVPRRAARSWSLGRLFRRRSPRRDFP